ncbi:MAG: hypothetical protein NTW03_01155 [Verrucomicrobia bacterium]|nr:hypothetical protein [Verrucomicrobiota bacterium]
MKHGQMPQSLDDLLARAEHYAGFAMRQMGRVPPAMLALSPGGLLFYMPEKMGDERAKDSFANTARLICIAHDASAVVMIMEAWMTMAAPGETLDPTERPSEAFDRREVVVVAGETRGKQKQKFLPIIRTDAGGFFGFGESDVPQFDNFQGRFTEILPPHPPAKEMQAKARLLLQAMDIADGDLQDEAQWS